jgi:hypothetical protein
LRATYPPVYRPVPEGVTGLNFAISDGMMLSEAAANSTADQTGQKTMFAFRWSSA